MTKTITVGSRVRYTVAGISLVGTVQEVYGRRATCAVIAPPAGRRRGTAITFSQITEVLA